MPPTIEAPTTTQLMTRLHTLFVMTSPSKAEGPSVHTRFIEQILPPAAAPRYVRRLNKKVISLLTGLVVQE
jgi:hypothetical protein